MNRRQFATTLGGTAAAAALTPWRGSAAESAAVVSATARALYQRALILDCNSAPPTPEQLPLPQTDLDLVRDSGVNAVKWSLGGINSDFAATVAEIALVQKLIELHPRYFTQVRSASDLARAKRARQLGLILSFESTDMLGDKLESFTVFRNLGVLVMQLSYNRKSPFAAGVMEPEAGGLTPLGREAVAEMERLGIAIDLSHANAATTSDVLAVVRQATHHDAHGRGGRACASAHQERCAAARARRQGRRRGHLRSAVPDRLAAPADRD